MKCDIILEFFAFIEEFLTLLECYKLKIKTIAQSKIKEQQLSHTLNLNLDKVIFMLHMLN